MRAEAAGWEQIGGKWYDPQCAADHAADKDAIAQQEPPATVNLED